MSIDFPPTQSSTIILFPNHVENQRDMTITPSTIPARTINNISPNINDVTGFPLHPRYPIPFSVETPNHDDSRMNENTYPQFPTNPSDANNDLDLLKDLRKKYQNNPAIGYLNINSLRGQKFSQLEQISKICELDILCIDETKFT